MRNFLRQLFVVILVSSVFINCVNTDQDSEPETNSIELSGKTMGTTYQIIYQDSLHRNFSREIKQILAEVNSGVNTYDPHSVISLFNQSEESIELDIESVPVQHFLRNWQLAKEVFETTAGNFDPTVMPLVNYWGFGYDGKQLISGVDSIKVDSLKELVGFDKVLFEELSLKKEKLGIQLDFSACAKGYGIDEVGRFLEKMGCQNYFVEIGGENRARGQSPKGRQWRSGINEPRENAAVNEFITIVELPDLSLATSGNYRNFYEVNGVKYSHTINPETGFPERNTLLSASVLTKECMVADAYATAFMVMGTEKAYQLALELPEIEAILVYSDEEGQLNVKITPQAEKLLVELDPAIK